MEEFEVKSLGFIYFTDKAASVRLYDELDPIYRRGGDPKNELPDKSALIQRAKERADYWNGLIVEEKIKQMSITEISNINGYGLSDSQQLSLSLLLNKEQLNAFLSGQFRFNSGIANIEKFDLGNIVNGQLADLSPEVLRKTTETNFRQLLPRMHLLSAVQVAALEKHLHKIPREDAQALKDSQLSQLSAQTARLIRLRGVTPEDISTLSPAQVRALGKSEFQWMEADQIRALSPSQLQIMSGEQIAFLIASHRDKLTKEQVHALTKDQVQYISEHYDISYPGLSSEQVQSLNVHTFISEAFMINNLSKLSPKQTQELSPRELAELPAKSLYYLMAMRPELFSPEQITQFVRFSGLPPYEREELDRKLWLRSLTPAQLWGIDVIDQREASEVLARNGHVLTNEQLLAVRPFFIPLMYRLSQQQQDFLRAHGRPLTRQSRLF